MKLLFDFMKHLRKVKSFILLICLLTCVHAKGQGDPNMLVDFPDFDPTFETGLTTGLWGGSMLIDNNAYTGSFAALLDDDSQWGGGLELLVTGLSPLTKYQFSAYVKLSSGSEAGSLVVKEYGGEELNNKFFNTTYEKQTLVFTTGLGATSAKIAIYNEIGGTNVIYADDLSLFDMGPGDPSSLDPIDSTDYKLIWSDEFNVDGPIDHTKWVSERGFQRNNEAQYYLPDNLVQKDGNLVISAIREQYANEYYDPTSDNWKLNREYASWTSGSINTAGKFDFLYGRVECRAKVSNLTGTWPAIWTVGQIAGEQTYADAELLGDCQSGEWPAGGEIDIMENYGNGILGNFALAGSGRWNAKWDARKIAVSEFGDPEWSDKYHVWTLDWTENYMKIYVDGILINEFDPNTTNNSDSYSCPGTAPFKGSPQLLWLNLALGGNAGGSTSALPDSTVYLVDYIRVYQLNSQEPTSPINMIDDPGFETGASTYLWGGSSVVTNAPYAGSYVAELNDNSTWGGGYEHLVSNLSPNTSYRFSAYVTTQLGEGRIGVKEYGGSEIYTSFTNTAYTQQYIDFTTGVNDTSAKIYIYNPPGGAETIYADDLELIALEPVLKSGGLSIVGEEEIKENFSIYPNPASEKIVVNFDDTNEHYYSIVSLNGLKVKEGKVSSGAIIGVSDIIPGVYLFKISFSSKVKKIIIK
ncbi:MULTISPECIES: family 16 glycosylhydrolase [unclassified Carboxylicivirga]|uniref:family 16 glycosylhydrolase n=1 Tax=Carboxylicivirga TaxID=1628153 RepID=UPI003D352B93